MSEDYLGLLNDLLLYKPKEEIVKMYIELKKENNDLQITATNCKQAMNKAIKYIEKNNATLYTFEADYDYEENLVDNYEISSYAEDLLKILKGDSDA